MSSSAANFVGSIPENYDTGLGPHIFEPYAADLVRRACAITPTDILELAAGTGIVSQALHAALPQSASLVVTDLNEPMLEIAQSKISPAANASFQAVDACELPFTDASFDLIVSQFGVMFFPDKAKSYREAARVLRPKGRYMFSVWGSWSANPFAQVTHQVVVRHFPQDPPGFYKVPFGYNDAAEIEGNLRAAGFASVEIETVKFSDPIKSLEDFSRGLVFGNPVSQEIEERGGDCNAVRDDVFDKLESELGGVLELEALVINAFNE
ncbi:class I SAM-dependent methyltransferase [Altererythrobacter sp. MF3-039]|uniref:class I SAM-dependent methyltransferase n=1 Tax=Altererythrobacter sp. MF3-039 TaxID=3252901 RepID=UPI00390C4014